MVPKLDLQEELGSSALARVRAKAIRPPRSVCFNINWTNSITDIGGEGYFDRYQSRGLCPKNVEGFEAKGSTI
jgi:hypothetical protein